MGKNRIYRDDRKSQKAKAAVRRGNTMRKRYPSRDEKSKNFRTAEPSSEGTYSNDPAWYGSNMLAAASSNLFFSKRFGTGLTDILPEGWAAEMEVSVPQYDCAIPGIMVLNMVPSFGIAQGGDSPINVAAQAIYSFVRHANAGSRVYDPADLMTYLIAMSEVYSFINWLQRVYGYMNTYFPENTYFAEAMVKAMGVNFQSILGNAANFAFWINVLINKATAFAVPAGMSYFTRKAFLYQNAWIESDNIKDQVYMFNPRGFYVYTIDDEHPEAYMKYEPLPENASYDALVEYGNTMIQNLLNAEDIGICSGDIIKAYQGDLIKLSEMPSNFKLMPAVGDDYVMYQIRNASVVSMYVPADLCQDDDKQYLVCDSIATITASTYREAAELFLMTGNNILTSGKHDPTAEDVMESTRLMVNLHNCESDGEGHFFCDAITGTEVVTDISMYRYSFDASTGARSLTLASMTNTVPGGTATNLVTLLAMITAFRYHPTVHTFTQYAQNNMMYRGFVQDLETVTTVDYLELSAIHEAALLNMLAVPAIAKL